MEKWSALIVSILILCSCSERQDEALTSASACAATSSKGQTIKCEVQDSERERLRESLMFSVELNRTHPGPTPDLGEVKHEVASVSPEGYIQLENDVKLGLAGLDCDAKKIVEYFDATFFGNFSAKILFQATGDKKDDVQFAYLWEVSDIDSPETDDSLETELGPILSPINENAITSGWCNPIEQPNHEYHERYKKIAVHAESL